jgi:hypothetical protein
MREELDDPPFRSARDAWPDDARGFEAMMVIPGAVSGADPQLHHRWFREGNMYADWNIAHFVDTPWNRFEAKAAGFDLHIELKIFEKPQQACYFSFAIPTERPMSIVGCSVYMSPDQTLEALRTLVDLKADTEAFADNQAGLAESHTLLWPDR